ncbi:MAG TPA: isoprenylcysteine carboxylmethyltransferase family protein [Candidatus Baltobacteraceae bacterium]|jgi:methyltransferase|nr:isoprenylcysteine carboxylmethyltransferase family protein [Candidatus Baltobacteraceae bacterium]
MILGIVLLLVAAQRIAEVTYAERNTRALRARGALEVAPEQHVWFVALHAAWLLSLWLFVPHDTIPNWWLIGLYAVLQCLRVWVLTALGPFWTTRIITLPDAPLVRRGPYRFMRHPNYAIVIAEIAVLPLAFGAWVIAIVFELLNVALLMWRTRAEDAALQTRRAHEK